MVEFLSFYELCGCKDLGVRKPNWMVNELGRMNQLPFFMVFLFIFVFVDCSL